MNVVESAGIRDRYTTPAIPGKVPAKQYAPQPNLNEM
ncbi:hypothetical protein FEQ05_03379 [Burkholderia pseudomultivorans]|uniref:Uncharacterized protein n=1 Tax=Burkholderia pseudomultivorans TaxID=1207504 RepID=A0ABU2E6W0_9BURK|nr:hypothetical protein [Burkholderia pseudomultivorans]MDR8737798.1 hypothetical protein [Burkholderia pseudomultivorans]MDR8743928.1 hypothetical protein [Burkholderia pseudomultivorans]MDR8755253.1 hypothetical protein [Burkholderia pseudomultivorans]MDR8780378.1 hypothetical protein [Burkholderia pseudomultivorans]